MLDKVLAEKAQWPEAGSGTVVMDQEFPSAEPRNGEVNPLTFDERGKVYRSGAEIRRHIVPELRETFARLERDGSLAKLTEAGMVRTWGIDDCTVGHEVLPFITYPQEWTLRMLHAAALCTLDVSIVLNRAGLRLHDPHCWNVSFRHGRPVYLDFSSIVEGKNLGVRWVHDFFLGFYVPLWLGSRRPLNKVFRRLARAVQFNEHDWRLGPQPRAEWRQAFGPMRLGRLCRKFWSIVNSSPAGCDPLQMLEKLREHVASLDFGKLETPFGDYKDPGGGFGDRASYSPKAKAVCTLLESLPPGRVVDLACNKGWFCGLAASMGHIALGIDLDENAVDAARESRAGQWGIDVAKMNVLWPTPGQGAFLMYQPALDRWQCDTVMLIAVEHHLVLRNRIGFEALAVLARRLGANNVIIEWVASDDVVVQWWLKEKTIEALPAWYTETDFVATFSRHFPRHRKVPSGAGYDGFPEPIRRTMYLFQR